MEHREIFTFLAALLLLSGMVAAQDGTDSGDSQGIIDGIRDSIIDTTQDLLSGGGSGGDAGQEKLKGSYYSLAEVSGTGVAKVRVKTKLYLKTPDYSGIDCYWTTLEGDGQELTIQKADDKAQFNHIALGKKGSLNQVLLDNTGEIKFYVPAPESEVGNTYRVISQCFRNGKATNIIKTGYTTSNTYEEPTSAYGADIQKIGVRNSYGINGKPKGALSKSQQKAINQNIESHEFENVEVSSCSISPRVLSEGQEYTIKVQIKNNNDHALKYKVGWPVESSNLVRDFENQDYDSVSTDMGSSKTGILDAKSSKMIKETSTLTNQKGIGHFELLGKRTHELKASVGGADSSRSLKVRLVSEPVKSGSCSVSCGYFTRGDSLNPQGSQSKETCVIPENAADPKSKTSKESAWVKGCPGNPTSEQEKKKCILENLGPMCVGASKPACKTIMQSLCLSFDLKFDRQAMRCK